MPYRKEKSVIEKHPFSYILTTRFKSRLIQQFLEETKRKKMLDIGCGGGFILSQMESKFRYAVGVDMSKESVTLGRKFLSADLLVADAQELPFKDGCFDCVISTDAFEHIPDDMAAIREVKRVLEPGGILIIYVPSRKGILSNTKFAHLFHTSRTSYLLDQRYYTINSLRRLVEDGGLKVEYAGYHNVFIQEFFTQGLKWIASLMNKKYEHQADINGFLDSPFFPVYRRALLPVVSFLVRVEEIVCEKVFRAHIPGHRIIMKCNNIKT